MTLTGSWLHVSSAGAGLLYGLCVAVLLFIPPHESIAFDEGIYVAPKQVTLERQRATITIGVPDSYRQRGIDLPEGEECEDVGEDSEVCKVYRFGNDYQLLDWLENARIDGAYVSSVMLQLLHNYSRQRFRDHFRAIRLNKSRDYFAVLSATQDGRPVGEPLQYYFSYLESQWNAHENLNGRFRFRSHLDPSLLALYLRTKQWMLDNTADREQGIRNNRQTWQFLIAGLEFGDVYDRMPPVNDAPVIFQGGVETDCNHPLLWTCLDTQPVDDYLVLRSQVPSVKLPDGVEDEQEDWESNVDEWFRTAPDELGLDPVRRFVRMNYRSKRFGATIKRYFRFTIPELLEFLRTAPVVEGRCDGRDGHSDLALVLTGGGVKAAYQTRLIDYLYGIDNPGNRLLVNQSVTGEGDDHPVTVSDGIQPMQVKHVIGTSGGALLGLFVATHPPGSRVNYSDILWKERKSGGYLTSLDIFPAMDLMRWLSFVVSIILFSCVATIYVYSPRLTARYDLKPESSVTHIDRDMKVERDEKGRFLGFSLVWIAFMLVVPWLVDYVNDNAFEEHIPAVQGIFYFLYILLGVYTDNNIVRTAQPRDVKGGLSLKLWVVLVLGLAATFAPVLYTLLTDNPDTVAWLIAPGLLSWRMTTPSMVCISGLLLVAVFLHCWYIERSPDYRPITSGKPVMIRSFLILFLVAALTLLIMIILYGFRIASLLELSPNFWKWQIPVSIIVSIGILQAGLSRHSPQWLRGTIEPKLRFLLLPHPSRTLLMPLTRDTRMVLFFTVTWGWWNLVIAPGLYGNQTAQDYLYEAWDHVVQERTGDTAASRKPGAAGPDFQTFYVAPATSLRKKLERYFLFNPGHAGSGNPEQPALPYRCQLEISSDGRWTQFDPGEISERQVLDIAFASGSPFPVFPAHHIEIHGGSARARVNSEWLVDGGYAHNTPIEAAEMLGANRVLVISSSPLDTGTDSGSDTDTESLRLDDVIGKMATNLPRLVPYFYGRSQVEDLLSSRNLMIVTLAPIADADDWPVLTDFRRKVIKRMLTKAERDIHKRIGYVQNWGSPDSHRRTVVPEQ